jgi:hypothetical protein
MSKMLGISSCSTISSSSTVWWTGAGGGLVVGRLRMLAGGRIIENRLTEDARDSDGVTDVVGSTALMVSAGGWR